MEVETGKDKNGWWAISKAFDNCVVGYLTEEEALEAWYFDVQIIYTTYKKTDYEHIDYLLKIRSLFKAYVD